MSDQDPAKTNADPPEDWPWADLHWKPRSFERDLVRAGALLAAELDRLNRNPYAEYDFLKDVDRSCATPGVEMFLEHTSGSGPGCPCKCHDDGGPPHGGCPACKTNESRK